MSEDQAPHRTGRPTLIDYSLKLAHGGVNVRAVSPARRTILHAAPEADISVTRKNNTTIMIENSLYCQML